MSTDKSEREAPSNSLPDFDECAMRVANSDFLAKRVAEGGYGPEADSKLANELHRFIYEYDDADAYRSAWFLHRLEKLINEVKAEAQPSQPATVVPVAQSVEWGDPKTVGMFVRQLQTIAPETPIHAAVHTDIEGKRVALTKPVTISRERVQGRRIRQGDQSVPYSIVVWASHDEAVHPSAPAESGRQPIESAPKDGTRILIWQAGSWQTARWQGHATGAEPSWPVGWRTALYVYPNVEWWAPLPAAPSAAQPGGEGAV